ncbi:exo-poly-alpha-D-galacturonosidase [Croceivirga radicis]|uniref:Exo-poly-alpha-D-galacturonosidase n=1 Tax=Croceivirga radicis TaxID=1929488 RepID=A0A1V6LPG6_9FLAO|nr:glycoside hydrolase family 28 protein [Croceivirga radicis]OQD42028.1 exo-poly-alpha-D-galacturonosidase [Croceivirga radicis]
MVLTRYLSVILLVFTFACKKNKETKTNIGSKTSLEPGWTHKVGAKNFNVPERIFYANDFGAQSKVGFTNTKAIQTAIDSCAASGGGIVKFRPGTYLSGSIFLKDNVQLHLDKEVTLLGSQNILDYKEIATRVAGIEMEWPAALVNAIDTQNVLISGEGTIDGQGKVFWDMYWDMRKNDYEPKGLRWIVDYDAKRPRTVLIQNSKNVIVRDLTLQRAGFWTVQILYSKHITTDGLTIRNNIGGHGPSTDGIDIDSSSYILVQNCDIDCNDDNFCLKAGRDWDGLRVNRPTEYVVIKDCKTGKGAGLLTVGSETSGGIRHIYANNIQGKGTDAGLKLKSATTRGGVIEDIIFDNMKMDSVGTFLSISTNWNPTYSYSKLPKEYNIDEVPEHWKTMLNTVPEQQGIPQFKNIVLNNVLVKHANKAISVSGLEVSTINKVYLKDVQINAATAGSINHSKNWKIDNVSLRTLDASKVELENCSNIDLKAIYD